MSLLDGVLPAGQSDAEAAVVAAFGSEEAARKAVRKFLWDAVKRDRLRVMDTQYAQERRAALAELRAQLGGLQ